MTTAQGDNDPVEKLVNYFIEKKGPEFALNFLRNLAREERKQEQKPKPVDFTVNSNGVTSSGGWGGSNVSTTTPYVVPGSAPMSTSAPTVTSSTNGIDTDALAARQVVELTEQLEKANEKIAALEDMVEIFSVTINRLIDAAVKRKA